MSLSGNLQYPGTRELTLSPKPITTLACKVEYLDVTGDCWMQVEDYKAPSAPVEVHAAPSYDSIVEPELGTGAETPAVLHLLLEE